MGLIDAHVHLYPPEVNASPAAWAEQRAERHWSVLCTRRRRDGRAVQTFPGLDELLRAMDEAAVERVVLQGWYWQDDDTCMLQNRFYAECVRRHPDRLSAFATFHPGAGAPEVARLVTWAADHGFSGLGELSPHSQGAALNDAAWIEALRRAGQLGWPVTLHVTEPHGGSYPGRVATPLDDFVQLARAFPDVTFVLAHWGARLPMDAALGEQIRVLKNVYYDTAASPLLYRPTVWREMVSAVGADRVLFGTDFPLVLYPKRESQPSFQTLVEEARQELSADEQRDIFHDNAARLLRLRVPRAGS